MLTGTKLLPACVEDTNWKQLVEGVDIDFAWEFWKSMFFKIMSDSVPCIWIVVCPSISWITPDLIKKIRFHMNYFCRSKHIDSPYYLQEYKSLSNEINAKC